MRTILNKGIKYWVLFILCGFLFLSDFSVMYSEAANLTSNAAHSDSKSSVSHKKCPGVYAIYKTEWHVFPDTEACKQQHINGCGNCYDVDCGNPNKYSAAGSDAFGVHTYNAWHKCRKRSPEKYSGCGPCESGDHNWSTVRHVTGTSRYRTNYRRCNVCLRELQAQNGSAGIYNYCSSNPDKGKGHWFGTGVNGSTKCIYCGAYRGSTYAGPCDNTGDYTCSIKWETSVSYQDTDGVQRSVKLTSANKEDIVVMYNSTPTIGLIDTQSDFFKGAIVGYEIYQDGSLVKSEGSKDINNLSYMFGAKTNTNGSYSPITYSTTVNGVTDVQFVLYTSAGKYTLPVISLISKYYWLNYDLMDGGNVIDSSTGMVSSGGQAKLAPDTPNRGFYSVTMNIPNPIRPGFTFVGWDISGMDTNDHYYGKITADTKTNETTLPYTTVTSDVTKFLNLRHDVGQIVTLKARWRDDNKPNPGDIYGNIGLTYRNYNTAPLNPDSGLYVWGGRISSGAQSYTISRQDGTLFTLRSVSMSENYPNAYGSYIQNETKTLVTYKTYPNNFGETKNGSRYYPGTWTNKSVKITATGYDGNDAENPTRSGGSGILRMRFDNEAWTNSNKAATDNSSFTIEKSFSNSGLYSGTLSIEDRAGIAVNTSRNSWLANPNGNFTTRVNYGQIKIDKDAPHILDPTVYNTSSKEFREAIYKMYEGYNDVRDVANGDIYGWAKDNVRIVIYADDYTSSYGLGSGVKAQAYCWNKDPNIASNWQSSDSTRSAVCGDGVTRTIPVSTRVVDRKEAGYVYVRDAVGNWVRINYNADHIDKQDPDVYPDKDPDTPPKDPVVPPDPLNPEDPDVDPYDPRPDGPYNFDGTDSTNELKYDWINHDGTIIFDAKDYGVSGSGNKGDNGDMYGSSGIWKMTLYRSNQNFPTVTETLSNGRTRQRANTNLYGSETVAEEVVFGNQITYVEHREGISYFILEVLDKADNLTSVKLTVKIDKTYPGIPHVLNPSESSALGIQNGGSVNGNDIISNFGSGKYWTIDQADLNKADYNNVDAYIQNEDNMKCYLEFIIYDENWTGEYAYGSNRSRDNSGFDEIKLKLIDADNLASNKTYIFYDYSNPAKEGKDTLGRAFTKNMTEYALSSENSVAYFYGDLTRETLVSTHFVAKINTFKDFPNASALNYEIEISDRAGNVKTYRNEPGNEIRNFSIKAVMNSAEDQTFNIETLWKMEAIIDNDTDVEKSVYVYENRLGEQYRSSYELTPAEKAEKGLNFVEMTTETVSVSTTVESGITAMTNVPYYQLGDMGFVDIWTVGYVPKVQFNFNTGGDPIGGEMVEEIRQGKIPAKYNLGVYGGAYDTTKHRIVPYTSGNKINVTYASDVDGVPFSMHYGVKERNDFVSPVIDTQRGWLENGTSIRMPIYYELTEDGGKNSDGKSTYHAELHKASFIAIKGNWKDSSTASYIIYDTRQNDIHHRITHES